MATSPFRPQAALSPTEPDPDGIIVARKPRFRRRNLTTTAPSPPELCWLAHDGEISKSDARRIVEGGAFEILWDGFPNLSLDGGFPNPPSERTTPAAAQSESTAPVAGRDEPEAPAPGPSGAGKITDPNAAIRPVSGLQFKAGRHRKAERIKQPFVATVAKPR